MEENLRTRIEELNAKMESQNYKAREQADSIIQLASWIVGFQNSDIDRALDLSRSFYEKAWAFKTEYISKRGQDAKSQESEK